MIDIALIDLGTIQQLRSGFEWSRQRRRAMASQYSHLRLCLAGWSLGERRSSLRVTECLIPTAAHRMHFNGLHTQEEKVKVSGPSNLGQYPARDRLTHKVTPSFSTNEGNPSLSLEVDLMTLAKIPHIHPPIHSSIKFTPPMHHYLADH
jgi:hypothetical protein